MKTRFVLLAIAAAPFVYALANYGTVSPCAILHQNTRATLMQVADEYARNSGAPDWARGLTSTLISMVPIDRLVDSGLTRTLGSAGPLQCLEAIAAGYPDKAELRRKMSELKQ